MADSWCRKIRSKNGTIVTGGAARNVRIAARGGMDEIVEQVARDAARRALHMANTAIVTRDHDYTPMVVRRRRADPTQPGLH